MTQNDDADLLHEMMSHFSQIGGSRYVMSIQYFIARDLMCHPEEYANKMVATDYVVIEFKHTRSVASLLHMLST